MQRQLLCARRMQGPCQTGHNRSRLACQASASPAHTRRTPTGAGQQPTPPPAAALQQLRPPHPVSCQLGALHQPGPNLQQGLHPVASQTAAAAASSSFPPAPRILSPPSVPSICTGPTAAFTAAAEAAEAHGEAAALRERPQVSRVPPDAPGQACASRISICWQGSL